MFKIKFSMWASGFCFALMLVQIDNGNAMLAVAECFLGFSNLMIANNKKYK